MLVITANRLGERYIPIDKFDDALCSLNFNRRIRGEELSIENFVNLANNIV